MSFRISYRQMQVLGYVHYLYALPVWHSETPFQIEFLPELRVHAADLCWGPAALFGGLGRLQAPLSFCFWSGGQGSHRVCCHISLEFLAFGRHPLSILSLASSWSSRHLAIQPIHHLPMTRILCGYGRREISPDHVTDHVSGWLEEGYSHPQSRDRRSSWNPMEFRTWDSSAGTDTSKNLAEELWQDWIASARTSWKCYRRIRDRFSPESSSDWNSTGGMSWQARWSRYRQTRHPRRRIVCACWGKAEWRRLDRSWRTWSAGDSLRASSCVGTGSRTACRTWSRPRTGTAWPCCGCVDAVSDRWPSRSSSCTPGSCGVGRSSETPWDAGEGWQGWWRSGRNDRTRNGRCRCLSGEEQITKDCINFLFIPNTAVLVLQYVLTYT